MRDSRNPCSRGALIDKDLPGEKGTFGGAFPLHKQRISSAERTGQLYTCSSLGDGTAKIWSRGGEIRLYLSPDVDLIPDRGTASSGLRIVFRRRLGGEGVCNGRERRFLSSVREGGQMRLSS